MITELTWWRKKCRNFGTRSPGVGRTFSQMVHNSEGSKPIENTGQPHNSLFYHTRETSEVYIYVVVDSDKNSKAVPVARFRLCP